MRRPASAAAAATNLLHHPPASDPAAAPPRRYQRDRGRRRPPAVRSGPARPLPHPRPGVGRDVVCGLDGHVQLRRRPRTAQGHRGARHRHRRVPPRGPDRAVAPWSRWSRSSPSDCRQRELQERVLRAGRGRPRRRRRPALPGAASTPRCTGCSTCRPSGMRPAPPCTSSWSPSSSPRPCTPSCRRWTTLGGQWDGYLEGQDLTGLDRERVRARARLHRGIEAAGLGVTAVDAAGAGADAAHPSVPAQLPGLRGRARPGAAAGTGRASTGPTAPASPRCSRPILWTLWGKARTTKEQIRSAGVGGDCVTEVEFEHEGHLYLVRRTLKRGQLHAAAWRPTATAWSCRGGPRRRAATSSRSSGWTTPPSGRRCSPSRSSWRPSPDQSPAERRRLVLRLLGITPLDAARDAGPPGCPPGDGRPQPAAGDAARPRRPARRGGRRRRPGRGRRRHRPTAKRRPPSRPRSAGGRRPPSGRGGRPPPPGVRRPGHRGTRRSPGARRGQPDGRRAASRTGRAWTAAGAADRTRAGGRRRRAAERELELLAAPPPPPRTPSQIVLPPEPPGHRGGHGRDGPRRRRARPASAWRDWSAWPRPPTDGAGPGPSGWRPARPASSDEADCPLCGQALGDAFEAGAGPPGRRARRRRAAPAAALAQVAQARSEAKAAAARQTSVVAAAEQARRARSAWEATDRRRRELEAARHVAWQAVLTVAPGRAAATGGPGSRGERPRPGSPGTGARRTGASRRDRARRRRPGRPSHRTNCHPQPCWPTWSLLIAPKWIDSARPRPKPNASAVRLERRPALEAVACGQPGASGPRRRPGPGAT